MEKRNLTPLRNVLVRYLVVCGGGSIVILLVWWGLFMSLIRNGFLLPPVTGAQVCSEARDYAATATVETFDPNAIDPLCACVANQHDSQPAEKSEEHISGRQAVGDGIIPIRGGYGGWRTLHFAV